MEKVLHHTFLFLALLAPSYFATHAATSAAANVTTNVYAWNNFGGRIGTNTVIPIPSDKAKNFTVSFDSTATSNMVFGLYPASTSYNVPAQGSAPAYSTASNGLGAAIEFRIGISPSGITTVVAYDTDINSNYSSNPSYLPTATTDPSLYQLPPLQNPNGTTTYFLSVYLNPGAVLIIDIEYLNTTTGQRCLILRQTNETINPNSTFWSKALNGSSELSGGFSKIGFRKVDKNPATIYLPTVQLDSSAEYNYTISNISAVTAQNIVDSATYPWGVNASKNYSINIDTSCSKIFTATFTANPEHDLLIGLYSADFNTSAKRSYMVTYEAGATDRNSLGAIIELAIGGWDQVPRETTMGTNATQSFAIRYEMNNYGECAPTGSFRGTFRGNTNFSPTTIPAGTSTPMVIPGIRGSAITYVLTVTLTQAPTTPSLVINLSYIDPKTQQLNPLMVLADSSQSQLTLTENGGWINSVAPTLFSYLIDPNLFAGFTAIGFRSWAAGAYSIRNSFVTVPQTLTAPICDGAVNDTTIPSIQTLIDGAATATNTLGLYAIEQGNVNIDGSSTVLSQSAAAAAIADLQNNATYSLSALSTLAATQKNTSPQTVASAATAASCSVNAAINAYNAALIWGECLDILAQNLKAFDPSLYNLREPLNAGPAPTVGLLSFIAAQAANLPSSRPTATTYTSLSTARSAQAAAQSVLTALTSTKLTNNLTVAETLLAAASNITKAIARNPLPVNRTLNTSPIVFTHTTQSNGSIVGTTSPTYSIGKDGTGKLCDAIVLTMGNVPANPTGMYWTLYDDNNNLLYSFICGGWGGTCSSMSIHDTKLQSIYGSTIWVNNIVSANTGSPTIAGGATTTGTVHRIINTTAATGQSFWDVSNISNGTITLQTPPDLHALSLFWQGNATNLVMPSTGNSCWFVITQDATKNLIIASGHGPTVGASTGFVWRSPIPATRPTRFSFGNYDFDFTINTIINRSLSSNEQMTLFDQSGNKGPVVIAADTQNASIMRVIANATAGPSLAAVTNDAKQANTLATDASTSVNAGIAGTNQSQTQTYPLSILSYGATSPSATLGSSTLACAQIASALNDLLNGTASVQGTKQAAASWPQTSGFTTYSATFNGISYTAPELQPTTNGSIAMARAACSAALLWAEWVDINAQTLIAGANSLAPSLQVTIKNLQTPPTTGTPTGYETSTLINLVKAQIAKLPALVSASSPTDTNLAAQQAAGGIITALQTTIAPLIKQAATAVANVASQVTATQGLASAIVDVTTAGIPTLISGAATAVENLQTAGVTSGNVMLNGTTTPLTQSALASLVTALQNDSTFGIAARTTAVRAATSTRVAASYVVNAAINAYSGALAWAECLDLQAQKLNSPTLQNDTNTGTQALLALILAQTGNIPSTRPTSNTYTTLSTAQAAQTKAAALLTAFLTTKQANGSTLLQNLQTADTAITAAFQKSNALGAAVADVTNTNIPTLVSGAATAVSSLQTTNITSGNVTLNGNATPLTHSALATTVTALQNDQTFGITALATAVRAATSTLVAASCVVNAAMTAYSAALTWVQCLDLQAQKLGVASLQSDPSVGTEALLALILAQASNIPTTRPTSSTYTVAGDAQTAQTKAEALLTAFFTTKQANSSTLLQNIQAADGAITAAAQKSNALATAIADVTNTNIPTLISGAAAAVRSLQTTNITSGSVTLNGSATPLTQSALGTLATALQNDPTNSIAALTTAVKAATTPLAAAAYAVNAIVSAYFAALTWAQCLDLQAQKLDIAPLQSDPSVGTQALLALILAQAGNIPSSRPTSSTYTTPTDAQTAQAKAETLLTAFFTTKQANGSTLLQNLQAADTAITAAIQKTNALAAATTNVTSTNIPTLISGAITATGNLQTAGITSGSVTFNSSTTTLTQSALATSATALQNDSTTGIAALVTAVKAATSPLAAAASVVNAAINAYTAAMIWLQCLDLQAQKLKSTLLQSDQKTGTQALMTLVLAQANNIPTTRPTNSTYTTLTDAQTAQTKAETLLTAFFTTKQANGSTLLQNLQAADSAATTATQSTTASSSVADDVASADNCINNALLAINSLATAGITTTSVTVSSGTTVSLSSAAVTDLQNNSTYGTSTLKGLAQQLTASTSSSNTTIINAAVYTVNAAITIYNALLMSATCVDLMAQKVIGTGSDKSLQTNTANGTQSTINAIISLAQTLPTTRPTTYSSTSAAITAQTTAHTLIGNLTGTTSDTLMSAANAVTNRAIQNAISAINQALPDAKTADNNAQTAITAASNLPSTAGNKASLVSQAKALQNTPATSGGKATGTGPNLAYLTAALKALPTGTQSYTTLKDAVAMCVNALNATTAAGTIADNNAATLKAIADLQTAIGSTPSTAAPSSSSNGIASGSPLDILNRSLTTGQTNAMRALNAVQDQAEQALATLKTLTQKASGSARATATSLQASIGDLLNRINTTLSTVKKQAPPFTNQTAALKAKATFESAISYVKQVTATLAARTATITNLQSTIPS